MKEELLLDLLERVLGKSGKGNYGNHKFICPFHISNPPGKKKLEINLETGEWACWSCPSTNKSSGLKIKSLFTKLKVSNNYLEELSFINKDKSESKFIPKNITNKVLELPKEFIPLNDDINNKYLNIIKKHVLKYLKNRNISNLDIIKYGIGFCTEGEYSDRVIIPSYDSSGKLNYFMARSFKDDYKKYKNPEVKTNNIIGFENLINWSVPIILCEGIFDAMAIKRNVIPLFGKQIPDALTKKIITSQVNKIYIALDKDALKDALKHCEQLLNAGKEVYLVELDDKDPSKIGFSKFIEIISKTQPLTLDKLLIKKLGL